MQSSDQLVIGQKKQHYRKYYITIDILQNIKYKAGRNHITMTI